MADKAALVEGAVVSLRSGGPAMTVQNAPEDGAANVYCAWFTETGELRTGSFKMAMLKEGAP